MTIMALESVPSRNYSLLDGFLRVSTYVLSRVLVRGYRIAVDVEQVAACAQTIANLPDSSATGL